MLNSNKRFVIHELNYLFQFRKTERLWHIPLMASLCTGIPLLIGHYFNNLHDGILACIAGLVILYFPNKSNLKDRMLSLLVCSFGFMISFSIGLLFSFNTIVSSLSVGCLALAVHWIVLKFKVNPPGSFFFVFVAAIASCMPHNLNSIPEKVGLVGLGCMFACLVALVYSLITMVDYQKSTQKPIENSKIDYNHFVEAFIFGSFISISFFIGYIFKLHNPYWIPVSCMAVMQGASMRHIWRRSIHRIIGTLFGLAFCWIILSINSSPLSVCISIICLQFIIEMLIVRNYTLAVVFITPMTILLAETANPYIQSTNHLITARLIDILIGSCIGMFGGWFIYQENIRYAAIRRVRKVRLAVDKLRIKN